LLERSDECAFSTASGTDEKQEFQVISHLIIPRTLEINIKAIRNHWRMVTNQKSAAPFTMAGLLVGALLPMALAVAIMSDSDWVFNFNTLSDLGSSDVEFTAKLFNCSCIIAGALILIFGIGKAYVKCGGLDRASGLFIATSGIILAIIGIVTKDSNLNLHILIAGVLFCFMVLSIVLSMFGHAVKGRKFSAAAAAIVLIIVAMVAPGFTPAGLEVISVFACCGWFIIESLSLSFSKN
jgi:hypothetical membrane protein